MLRRFDYEVLELEDRERMHDALIDMSARHVEQNDVFETKRYDPKSPSHRLETVTLPPIESSFEEIDALAKIADAEFYGYLGERMDAYRPLLSATARYLEEGKLLRRVCTHGNITDVAYMQVANLVGYGKLEFMPKKYGFADWQGTQGLMLSRGTAAIRALVEEPVPELLQRMTRVYMSWPRTRSVETMAEEYKETHGKKLNIDRMIDTGNKDVRKAINEEEHIPRVPQLLRKLRRVTELTGHELNAAWTGSTDEVRWGDDHKPEEIILGKVTKGTIKLMRSGLVLPAAIWYSDKEPFFEYGELTIVKNLADAVRVQKWQAASLERGLGMKKGSVKLALAV